MAILFDASSGGVASSTSLTYSHTCTGSNRILFVGILTGGTNDIVTGVTYGGVSMSQVNKQVATNGYMYSYILIAPATGANNVVVSVSPTQDIWSASASYTGATQSSQPHQQGTAVQASGTSFASQSLTPTLTNTWHISWFRSSANLIIAAGSGTTKRQSPATSTEMMIADSNGEITINVAHTLNATGSTGQWTSNGIVLSSTDSEVGGTGNFLAFF